MCGNQGLRFDLAQMARCKLLVAILSVLAVTDVVRQGFLGALLNRLGMAIAITNSLSDVGGIK